MTYKLKNFDINLTIPKSAPLFISQTIESGEWEKWECEIIKKAIKNHRVLEGGSCLGATSILLDRQADFVISFEANPQLAKIARANQKINGSSAKIVNAALGLKDSKVKFSVSPDLWDSKIGQPKKNDKVIKIKEMDTERLIKQYGINAIVLDVEGEEERILTNINLSPIQLVIAELHEHINKDMVINKLKEEGFQIKNYRSKVNHSILWAERKNGFIAKVLSKVQSSLVRR